MFFEYMLGLYRVRLNNNDAAFLTFVLRYIHNKEVRTISEQL